MWTVLVSESQLTRLQDHPHPWTYPRRRHCQCHCCSKLSRWSASCAWKQDEESCCKIDSPNCRRVVASRYLWNGRSEEKEKNRRQKKNVLSRKGGGQVPTHGQSVFEKRRSTHNPHTQAPTIETNCDDSLAQIKYFIKQWAMSEFVWTHQIFLGGNCTPLAPNLCWNFFQCTALNTELWFVSPTLTAPLFPLPFPQSRRRCLPEHTQPAGAARGPDTTAPRRSRTPNQLPSYRTSRRPIYVTKITQNFSFHVRLLVNKLGRSRWMRQSVFNIPGSLPVSGKVVWKHRSPNVHGVWSFVDDDAVPWQDALDLWTNFVVSTLNCVSHRESRSQFDLTFSPHSVRSRSSLVFPDRPHSPEILPDITADKHPLHNWEIRHESLFHAAEVSSNLAASMSCHLGNQFVLLDFLFQLSPPRRRREHCEAFVRLFGFLIHLKTKTSQQTGHLLTRTAKLLIFNPSSGREYLRHDTVEISLETHGGLVISQLFCVYVNLKTLKKICPHEIAFCPRILFTEVVLSTATHLNNFYIGIEPGWQTKV